MSAPGGPATLGSPGDLLQPLGLLRLAQLVCTCVAFSLVASVDAWVGSSGDWCMFAWCFSFAMTLVIVAVELGRLQAGFPRPWLRGVFAFTCYAALFCLSASVIYPATHVRFMARGSARDHGIAATAFSCLACLAYATEAAWARAGGDAGYAATPPGLLKVLETSVACLIFVFLSDHHLYRIRPALEWCVAVYAICFVLAAGVLLLSLSDCTRALPVPFASVLSGVAVLSVLFYASAAILWPLYQFSERLGGFRKRGKDLGCQLGRSFYVCSWDRRLAVTILTAVNLLAYVADLMCLACPGVVGA